MKSINICFVANTQTWFDYIMRMLESIYNVKPAMLKYGDHQPHHLASYFGSMKFSIFLLMKEDIKEFERDNKNIDKFHYVILQRSADANEMQNAMLRCWDCYNITVIEEFEELNNIAWNL